METTIAPQNQKLIQQIYDDFAAGNIPAVLAMLTEDIHWHVPGRGPISGDYHGPAEVLGFFEHFRRLADEGSFSIRIDDMLAKGDRVIVLCTESATPDGRSWSSPQVHAWTVRGGKASVWWQFQGDQQTEDEFWS
ncbi:MAG: nuclear transport factor 2 family protein [Pseudonocardiales bacterium]|nr:nuclear transport factor 2 family protein [Pseudonocardiales bacterium]